LQKPKTMSVKRSSTAIGSLVGTIISLLLWLAIYFIIAGIF